MIGTNKGNNKLRSRRNIRKRPAGRKLFSSVRSGAKRPAMVLGLMAAMGLLMTGLFMGYQWATTTEQFVLTEIEVTGNEHLSYGNVLAAGHITLGINCLDLNVGAVQARLSKNPWVADVAVRRELPGRLRVEITEKKATYWTVSNDKLYYADKRGNLITAVTPGDISSLPVLNIPAQLRGKTDALPLVFKSLLEHAIPFNQARLASVQVFDSGEIEYFMDRSGLTLRFSLKDFETHLDHMERVIADLLRRGELAAVVRIVAGPDRVWVEMKS